MKKKINIILLLAVLGLWGTVLYKYVNQYFFKEEINVSLENKANIRKLLLKDKDTFELKALPRDPFLGKTYAEKRPTEKIISNRNFTPKPVVKVAKPIVQKQLFPTIHYYGFIKNETGGSELVLLKMNGKLLKVKNNETKEGLKIIKIFKDSIKVSFNGETKVVRK